jgi:hypothetical protein
MGQRLRTVTTADGPNRGSRRKQLLLLLAVALAGCIGIRTRDGSDGEPSGRDAAPPGVRDAGVRDAGVRDGETARADAAIGPPRAGSAGRGGRSGAAGTAGTGGASRAGSAGVAGSGGSSGNPPAISCAPNLELCGMRCCDQGLTCKDPSRGLCCARQEVLVDGKCVAPPVMCGSAVCQDRYAALRSMPMFGALLPSRCCADVATSLCGWHAATSPMCTPEPAPDPTCPMVSSAVAGVAPIVSCCAMTPAGGTCGLDGSVSGRSCIPYDEARMDSSITLLVTVPEAQGCGPNPAPDD